VSQFGKSGSASLKKMEDSQSQFECVDGAFLPGWLGFGMEMMMEDEKMSKGGFLPFFSPSSLIK